MANMIEQQLKKGEMQSNSVHHDGDPYERPPPVRLSVEEMRVLKECNRESFYYRCVPISSVAMMATHWAVKSGYLKPNLKWGSTFKVLGAGLVGYFVGKFSYQGKCAEKIMQLPNSVLGDTLRRRYNRPISFQEMSTAFDDLSRQQHVSTAEQAGPSPTSPALNKEHDSSNQFQGLDDSLRPTIDSPASSSSLPEEAAAPRKPITYEELRQQNRNEFEAKKRESYQRRQPSPAAAAVHPKKEVPSGSQGAAKNKYGDVWDD